MVAGAVPRGSHEANDVATFHPVAGLDHNFGVVTVIGFEAAAVINHDKPSIAALPGGELDQAIRGGLDWRSQGIGNVEPSVEFAVSLLKWIAPEPEPGRHRALHRPAERRGSEELALVLNIIRNFRIVRHHHLAGLLYLCQLALHVFHAKGRDRKSTRL